MSTTNNNRATDGTSRSGERPVVRDHRSQPTATTWGGGRRAWKLVGRTGPPRRLQVGIHAFQAESRPPPSCE